MATLGLKEIAQRAGVSPSTVSRVANGKVKINSERRERIMRLLSETGYAASPAPAAEDEDGAGGGECGSAAGRGSPTAAVIIPETFNMFQRQLFSAIEHTLHSFGYRTAFFFITLDGSNEAECLERIRAEHIDGVIMLHEIHSPEFYAHIREAGIPVVSTMCNTADIPTIKIDDNAAAVEAVNHLLSLGHRSIGMIYGPQFLFGVRRAEGFASALEAAGIERDENCMVSVKQYSTEFGLYGMRELLLKNHDITAVFAASDELAIGAIRALTDAGVGVPDDMSVIGFDDIEIAGYFVPRLTTIHQPLAEIGEQSALSLHRRITGANHIPPEIIIPHKLIIRESTKSPADR